MSTPNVSLKTEFRNRRTAVLTDDFATTPIRDHEIVHRHGFLAESLNRPPSAVGRRHRQPCSPDAESVANFARTARTLRNIAVHDWDIGQSKAEHVLRRAGTPERTEEHS